MRIITSDCPPTRSYRGNLLLLLWSAATIMPINALADSIVNNGDGGTSVQGAGAAATGYSSTAYGVGSTASGTFSTAVGENSTASGFYSIANGVGSSASQYASVAYGPVSSASGAEGTAIGFNAVASQTDTVAVGGDSTASGLNSSMVGVLGRATGLDSTGLGYNSTAAANYSTVIGANAAVTASGTNSVALGQYSLANRPNTVSVGNDQLGVNRQITNVAAGSAPTDAVNMSQLNQVTTQANRYAARGVASALAATATVAPGAGKKYFGMEVGAWGGQAAIGVGFDYQTNDNVVINASVSGVPYGQGVAARGGVGFVW